MKTIEFIDSHTAGEPTRTIIGGGPDLGTGALKSRVKHFREEFDWFRRAAILEPRGSEALVGALVCEPEDTTCAAGVIFFNNSGYLNMCGHGTIGLAVTLAHLGRLERGRSRIETPVGVVEVELHTPNRASVRNVPAYRYRKQVEVEIPELGTLVGDIAWGGNWFFLVQQSPLPLTTEHLPELCQAGRQTLRTLSHQGITGAEGAPIDHIEFFGEPVSAEANSRNFVMCPGGEYDRSPCGTGTSAKMACLADDGLLEAGDVWVQEGILDTCFEGQFEPLPDGRIAPTITGDAYITVEGRLVIDAADPFAHGIAKEAPLWT